MKVPSYETACTFKERLCAKAFEVRLRLPTGQHLQFHAGQFVLFHVPDALDPSYTEPRAYSIASPPSQAEELLFVVEDRMGGRAGDWVRNRLHVGDAVQIQGPFGPFVLDTDTSKDYVFIGTGTGVAPFRSHLEWALKERGDTRKMDLFFGVRCEEDLFWKDEFTDLMEQYTNFTVHFCLSSPSDYWEGLKGRVTAIAPDVIDDFSQISTYVCGSPEMVKEVKSWLLSEGVPKSDVHAEGYI